MHDNAKTITREIATGSGAIAHTHVIATEQRLVSVTIKFSSAPTTSENLTITVTNGVTPVYLEMNPSTYSATSIVWYPDDKTILYVGDTITVTFTNTDGRTYGVAITVVEEE